MGEGAFFQVKNVFELDPRRPSCHGSTITELPNGDLLAAWYAGSYEKAGDVAILCSRLPREEDKWSEPIVLADTPDKSEGNPVLFVDDKRNVWLFFVTMYGAGWTTCKIKCKKSTDGGFTWSKTRVLRHRLGWMTRNKPIILENGDILLPVYDETKWHSMVMISEDGGETWRKYGGICAPQGVIQPTVVQLSNCSLLMYMRTGGGGGCIWKSVSLDDGRTWSSASPTPLRNPNSAIELVKLASGNIALAFNDTTRGRTPLNIALSLDEGATWPFNGVLEAGEGEFSYPAIIQDADGYIHIVYTNRRVNIRHVKTNEAWIKEGGKQTLSG